MTEHSNEIRKAIQELIDEGNPLNSTRAIILTISKRLGYEPSTATVAKILKSMGKTPTHRWE